MIGLDSIRFMSLIITTVMVIVSYLVMGLFGLLIIILTCHRHSSFIYINISSCQYHIRSDPAYDSSSFHRFDCVAGSSLSFRYNVHSW